MAASVSTKVVAPAIPMAVSSLLRFRDGRRIRSELIFDGKRPQQKGQQESLAAGTLGGSHTGRMAVPQRDYRQDVF